MDIQGMQKTDQIIIIHPKVHKHSLIWLHGMNSSYEANLKELIESLGDHLQYVKVLIPSAPTRYVTLLNQKVKSWFNVKSRGKQSFQLPFDEAFSSEQVLDSYQRILFPLIESERQLINKNKESGKLIICGFSQGCGLALHCLYESENVDGGLAISGYMFPFTKFDPNSKKPVKVIYGKKDKVRPWEYTKVTYEGRIPEEKITFVANMGHEVNSKTVKEIKPYFNQLFS